MIRQPLTDVASLKAHQLRLLLTGCRSLLDSLLEDMQMSNPYTERVEVLCVLAALIEDRAAELVQLCAESGRAEQDDHRPI